jgi:type IV pilus assembly protein PilE
MKIHLSGAMPKQRGITLVELLITVVIVGILTVVAVPSYRQFMQRSQRVEAKEALLHMANNQERFYLQNHTYADNLSDLQIENLTENGLYALSIVSADRQQFVVRATVVAGSGMETDSDCLVFTLDQGGERSASPDVAGRCW